VQIRALAWGADGARISTVPRCFALSRPHANNLPKPATSNGSPAVEVQMLTDWERRQLAEIEQGLNEDFRLRRRAGRLIGSIAPWAATSVVTFLGCLIVLVAIGAWHIAIVLAAVYGLVAIGHPRRRDHTGAGPQRPARG
jgi:hypothetical protein